MKLKSVIFSLFIFLLVAPLSIHASQESAIDKLELISDEALQMVKSSRYEDAKKLLDYFSEQFLTYTMDDRPFSMDELRIVTVAHNDAVEATTDANMSHNERVNRVTKFRLVMDAITSSHQPMWTEMEGPILTVFGGLKEAAVNGDNEDFHSKLNSFLSMYDVIYPSLKLDIAADRIQKLDARINFIDHYRPRVLTEASSQKELEILESDLKNIFDEMTEDDADPSLWWVIISTGSIIIVTLSYVGWRKYKGDKEIEKAKQRSSKLKN
ncbi:sporulation protein YpjB [Bacillus sp. 31A1R]|uniref:Sporulation protein YpjB n=1 Tax=Robertmurraya mangrovi TaxID=3098077 RepID=A0ABU5J1L7_9BACI|nr:sporulation protein YpjB [Bacillus sp. 31A1R]MDZ5473242.1 sporulation protein YpjB [Bacillus sp. 31A1R]